MKRRSVQYLGLLILLLASLGVIFFPIGAKPVGEPIQVPLVAPKPFAQLVSKGKTPADEADDALVKAFPNQVLPGTLLIADDGKTATINDPAPGDTREAAQIRADKIVAALGTKFKGIQLAPGWKQVAAGLNEKPLLSLPLSDYAIYPPKQREGKTAPAIKLGLDLQGGVNLVLQIRRASFPYRLASAPATPAAKEAILTKIRAGLGSSDANLGLRGTDVAFLTSKGSENQFEIRTQAKDQAQFDGQKKAIDALVKTTLGSSATPGRAQFYAAQEATAQGLGFGGDDYSKQLLNRTVEILRSRVDRLGVSEPVIQAQPPDRIAVQLPGVNDPQKAADVVGQTAQLQIVVLPAGLQAFPDPSDSNNTIFANDKGPVSSAEALELCQAESGRLLKQLGLSKTGEPQAVVTGQDVKPTTSAILDQGGRAAISFELQGQGSTNFAKVTTAIAGKGQIPIFLDERCVSAPSVNEPITGGSGQITGSKDIEEARGFALLLNSGALPAPIDIIENRTVSATLGNDSLVKSLRAGAIGLIAVAIFMIVFYRLPGILANAALAVYMVLNLAVFVLIGGTLTLPGIAGFLLALAMSLDTNILVFERLKEEMAIQPTFSAALRAAFNRAWTAILDSHVTTLIAATVLFYFGTGPVKGFALTLGVGILLSLFSAISVTRLFMWSVAKFGENNRSLMSAKLPAPPSTPLVKQV